LKESRRKLMANRKTSVILFSLLALTAIIISACERPFPTSVPLETAEGGDPGFFVSPVPTDPMESIASFATQTAQAETAVAALTAGTPPEDAQETETIPADTTDPSATPEISDEPSVTPTLGDSVTPSATQPAPTVITNRPGSYTLQKGEFPYCIARRFNVDPAELLSLNGLTNGEIYYPNLTLTIPQSGKPFPGTRALKTRPDTYTVADASLTVPGVACAYGDVDPAAIVNANSGVSLTSPLTVGQQLTIP
jgi:LysM repeat protein